MLSWIRKRPQSEMEAKTFRLNFMGDTMLGRLIDQMFLEHVYEPEEERIARSILSSRPNLSKYSSSSPWGNTLAVLQEADLNLLNLETSVTTHAVKWSDKVFNYRMHPVNIAALTVAKIAYAGLANNHTLDFSELGLLETVQTVKTAGIAFAGAGESHVEATRPAVLRLAGSIKEHEIHVWAAADHPADWAQVMNFHFLDYTPRTKARLKRLINSSSSTGDRPSLKVFSVHWGPNYAWQPADHIREMAHFLIEECDIDIIHGHSSHHVQGVEKYNGKLIMYGCGDFVDDYAVVPEYRNDLSAIWRIYVRETTDGGSLQLETLEMIPTKIHNFAVRLMHPREPDAEWVKEAVEGLSEKLGTKMGLSTHGEERMTVDLT
jgi:poly-gamma-glutamate capsule biosynthesis protein CapA/YwtB (metallophosphatase superfamily)